MSWKRKEGIAKHVKKAKIEYDEQIFDSPLELYCYKYLINKAINFKIKVKYVLIDKFKNGAGKTVRSMTWTPDFVIGDVIIDTKGFFTPAQKQTVKVYQSLYPNKWILLPNTQKKVRECIDLLKEENYEKIANLKYLYP